LQTAHRITQLWRYPIASIGGENVSSANIGTEGILGDRTHGLFDATSGTPAAPEKDRRWHKALMLSATSASSVIPLIHFPDGSVLSVEDDRTCAYLSDYFGFHVGIGRVDPNSGLQRYPLIEHRHKHFPLHVLTAGSLGFLAKLQGVAKVDVRRFRPNVLLEREMIIEDEPSFEETLWVGHHARIGSVSLAIEDEATRCGITIIPQPGIEDDPEVLRTILRKNRRRFGAYCSVEKAGTLALGDRFELI